MYYIEGACWPYDLAFRFLLIGGLKKDLSFSIPIGVLTYFKPHSATGLFHPLLSYWFYLSQF